MVKIIVISFYYTYLFKWIRCRRRVLNVSDDNSSSSTTPKTIKSALSWICAPLLLFVCLLKWSSKMHVIRTYLFPSFVRSLSLSGFFSLHTFIHHLAYKLVCAVCWMCRAAPVPHSISSNTIKSTHVCLSLNALVALVNHFGHRARAWARNRENMLDDATIQMNKYFTTETKCYLRYYCNLHICVLCVRNFHLEKVWFNT